MCTLERCHRVFMMRILGEPQREVLGIALALRRRDLPAIPVGLPGIGIKIQAHRQHQHLAAVPPFQHRSRRIDRPVRANQHIALRIERLARGIPELVPAIIALRRRQLVPVIGLQRQRPRIVDPHRIASCDLAQHLRIKVRDQLDKTLPGIGSHMRDSQTGPRCRAAGHHQMRIGGIELGQRRKINPHRISQIDRCHRGIELHAGLVDQGIGIAAQIARLVPEIVRIAGINRRNHPGNVGKIAAVHRRMVIPALQRMPQQRDFPEGRSFGFVQFAIGIAAAARLIGIGNHRKHVAPPQLTQRMHPRRHHRGNGMIAARHKGHKTVPHPVGILRRADSLIGPAAAAEQIAEGPVLASPVIWPINRGRHHPRVLRRRRIHPVGRNRRIGRGIAK